MSTIRMAAAQATFRWEARLKEGKIAVFALPKGDGGGVPVPGYPYGYEVAGINNRYHPVMAAKLRALVERGKPDEAANMALEYIAGYEDHADLWVKDQGLEFFLRDCVHNRGPGGAAMILQMALNAGVNGGYYKGLKVDGSVGPKTREKLAQVADADSARALLGYLRRAREKYERDFAHRNEDSPFWKGLVNRWNDIRDRAMPYIGKED